MGDVSLTSSSFSSPSYFSISPTPFLTQTTTNNIILKCRERMIITSHLSVQISQNLLGNIFWLCTYTLAKKAVRFSTKRRKSSEYSFPLFISVEKLRIQVFHYSIRRKSCEYRFSKTAKTFLALFFSWMGTWVDVKLYMRMYKLKIVVGTILPCYVCHFFLSRLFYFPR